MTNERRTRFRSLRRQCLYGGKRFLAKTAEYKALLAELLDEISAEEDPAARDFLRLYYYDAKSFPAISMATHYSESQLRRIKAKIVNKK